MRAASCSEPSLGRSAHCVPLQPCPLRGGRCPAGPVTGDHLLLGVTQELPAWVTFAPGWGQGREACSASLGGSSTCPCPRYRGRWVSLGLRCHHHHREMGALPEPSHWAGVGRGSRQVSTALPLSRSLARPREPCFSFIACLCLLAAVGGRPPARS